MHSVLLVQLSTHALGMQSGIELLNSSDDGVYVDLTGHSVVVVAFFYCLLQLFLLEFALYFVSDPLQTVFFEVVLHC